MNHNDASYKLLSKFFSGNCTPEEKQQVYHWMSENKENESLFIKTSMLWQDQNNHITPDKTEALKKLNQRIDANTPLQISFYKKNWFRYAAAAIILLMIAWPFIMPGTPQWQTITTKTGEKQEITLADGTIIWLNSSSTLRYPKIFKGDYRKVELNGQAFFKVAKNNHRPFTISTPNSFTTVLGTQFDLKDYANTQKVTLSVTEGKVLFTPHRNSKNKIICIANTGAEINKANKTITPNNSLNSAAWKLGRLSFDNLPFNMIKKDIEQYYHVKLIVTNDKILDQSLTISFENQDINTVINILNNLLETTLTIEKK